MERDKLRGLPLFQEDINDLVLRIHDWLEVTPLAATEEGYDWLHQLVDDYLEPFAEGGYRNYN